MTKEKTLILHLQKTVYIMIVVGSYYFGGEEIHMSIMNKFKLVMLYSQIIDLVHHDHLD